MWFTTPIASDDVKNPAIIDFPFKDVAIFASSIPDCGAKLFEYEGHQHEMADFFKYRTALWSYSG